MKTLLQWLGLCLLALLGLQLFFALRIALMGQIAPESTSFERSQMWQIVQRHQRLPWRQAWVPLGAIAPSLQRAVIDLGRRIFAAGQAYVALSRVTSIEGVALVALD